MKNRLDWYKHEVDSHNHWKFKILRRKCGWAGEGKFWALNNIIAKSEFCTLDLTNENKLQQISIELDFEVPELMEFLTYLADTCKLVMMKEMVISTQMTQENLSCVLSERERKREYKKSKEEPAPSEEKTGKQQNGQENQKVDGEKEKVDGENSQRREEKRREDNKEPKGSSKTGVLVPLVDEKILKDQYKRVMGDVEQLSEFIRNKRPLFIEPYAKRWNYFAVEVGLSQITALTEKRKQKFRTRIREETFDFIGLLEKAKDSEFLLSNGKWFTFDWVFKNSENHLKVMEGNYDNNKKPFIQKSSVNDYLQKRKQESESLKQRYGNG